MTRFRLVLVAAVAVHLALGLGAVLQKSITTDELYHLAGGYSFNALGDFRIHPDNGVLPQRLHALPAVLLGAHAPPLDTAAWRTADATVVGYDFLYRSGHDHWPLLVGARAVNALFGAALVVLVGLWARRLAGDLAGTVAAVLAALSPTLLAHTPLATTDAAAAFFLTAAVAAFWHWLGARTVPALAVSAAVFALACVTKFSAVLLLPIFALLVGVDLFFRRPGSARHDSASPQLPRLVGGLAAHALAAWVLIWACFNFRYAAAAPDLPPAETFAASGQWMLDQAGWQGRVLRVIGTWRLLPEAFLWGYTHTYLGSLSRGAYLAGEFSTTGWATFFPLTFAWKSTLAEIAAAAGALALAAWRRRALRPWLLHLAPLLALFVVYGGVALTSKPNIGHRHLLPLYPALFVVAGLLVARFPWRPRAIAAAFVVLQTVAVAGIFPHHLAYFNILAGGPERAWRLLVDSSLDWGQDLAGLRTWLERHNTGPAAAPVFLSYFGSGEPDYYQLAVRRLPFVNGFKRPPTYTALEAGLYCVSATTLVQVYSAARGPWTPALEAEFQSLRAQEPAFAAYFENPARRSDLERDVAPAQWQRAWARYDTLRFARLCHYLRVRPPDATVGHSILIYRLGAGEVRAATGDTLAAWSALLERALSPSPAAAR